MREGDALLGKTEIVETIDFSSVPNYLSVSSILEQELKEFSHYKRRLDLQVNVFLIFVRDGKFIIYLNELNCISFNDAKEAIKALSAKIDIVIRTSLHNQYHWAFTHSKRRSSKHHDLPIGIDDVQEVKFNKCGTTRHYTFLKLTCILGRKTTLTKSYSKEPGLKENGIISRSRSDALALLISEGNKLADEYYQTYIDALCARIRMVDVVS